MKNKKLIALLLIAAIVLGCATGAMANDPPDPPDTPSPVDLMDILLDAYGEHIEDYCEHCYYEQVLDADIIDQLNAVAEDLELDLVFTEGMTLGKAIELILECEVEITDGGTISIKRNICEDLFGSEEDLEHFFGTSDPDEVDSLKLATFVIVSTSDNYELQFKFFVLGESPFADCGEDCITCAAGECDCCKPDITEMLDCLRSLLLRLFTLFNYLNTGKIEFMN